MNEDLLALHKNPIDTNAEQRALKEKLAVESNQKIQSVQTNRFTKSQKTLAVEKTQNILTLIKEFQDLIQIKHKRAEDLEAQLSINLEKREQYKKYPDFLKSFDEIIASNRVMIKDNQEEAKDLEQQAIALENIVTHNLSSMDSFSNETLNTLLTRMDNEVDELSAPMNAFLEYANEKDQDHAALKVRVSEYAQVVEALQASTEVPYVTLSKIFQNLAHDHANVSNEYLDIFETIRELLPKLQIDMVDALTNYKDNTLLTLEYLDSIRSVDYKLRDQNSVTKILEGAMGKYMQGDLSFINHLNSQHILLSALDLESVSKEVELGRVKDRGVAVL